MIRKRYSPKFRAKIALGVLRGLRPIHEIAAKHRPKPTCLLDTSPRHCLGSPWPGPDTTRGEIRCVVVL